LFRSAIGAGLSLIAWVRSLIAPNSKVRIKQVIALVNHATTLYCIDRKQDERANACKQKAHQKFWSREITDVIDTSITPQSTAYEAAIYGTYDTKKQSNNYSAGGLTW